MIKVQYPQQLGGSSVEMNASTIQELLDKSDKRFNSRFINIFVNDTDIRFLNNKNTKLNDGDEVIFIPAIAGGLC